MGADLTPLVGAVVGPVVGTVAGTVAGAATDVPAEIGSSSLRVPPHAHPVTKAITTTTHTPRSRTSAGYGDATMRGIARLAIVVLAVVVLVQAVRWGLSRRSATAATEAGWPPLAPDAGPDLAAVTGATRPADTDAERPADVGAAWLEPDGTGSCPVTHPVKVNTGSGIFHVPGGRFYERTHADRCYSDGAAAAADGYRASKL